MIMVVPYMMQEIQSRIQLCNCRSMGIVGEVDNPGSHSTECCKAGAELWLLYCVERAFKYKTSDTHKFYSSS
jgi:ribosomal protein L2